MDKLSHALINLGFYPVLGTHEDTAGIGPLEVVKRGTPYTINSKNGVTVIYDERGWPWIIAENRFTVADLESLGGANVFKLDYGKAYVPHAADNGRFLLEVLSKL